MKLIPNWIESIKAEIPPSILSALVALGLIFFFLPTTDSNVKITLVNVIRMGILCILTGSLAYYAAIHYSVPYPFWVSVASSFFLSPISLGLFKMSVKFSRNPEKTIKNLKGSKK